MLFDLIDLLASHYMCLLGYIHTPESAAKTAPRGFQHTEVLSRFGIRDHILKACWVTHLRPGLPVNLGEARCNNHLCLPVCQGVFEFVSKQHDQ